MSHLRRTLAIAHFAFIHVCNKSVTQHIWPTLLHAFLDFSFHVVNRIRSLDIQRDSLASQRLDEDLHCQQCCVINLPVVSEALWPSSFAVVLRKMYAEDEGA